MEYYIYFLLLTSIKQITLYNSFLNYVNFQHKYNKKTLTLLYDAVTFME